MIKPKVIYVYDPMCGWCFGFSKVISKLHNEFQNEYDFEIISGGMVRADREGPIGDFADYILNAYKRVEDYSGVKFGKPYLEQLKTKTLWSGSTKPSMAIEAFKLFEPKHAIQFAALVQQAYFVEGKDLRDDSVYTEILKQFHVDTHAYLNALHSEEIRKATSDGFQFSANLGVTGYPSVVFVWKDKYYMVSRGFTNYDMLKQTIEKVKTTY